MEDVHDRAVEQERQPPERQTSEAEPVGPLEDHAAMEGPRQNAEDPEKDERRPRPHALPREAERLDPERIRDRQQEPNDVVERVAHRVGSSYQTGAGRDDPTKVCPESRRLVFTPSWPPPRVSTSEPLAKESSDPTMAGRVSPGRASGCSTSATCGL